MSPVLSSQETLSVEFKSNRKRFSDRDLIKTPTCLVNTDVGEILLGDGGQLVRYGKSRAVFYVLAPPHI